VKRSIPYGRQSIDEKDIEAVTEVLYSNLITTGPKVNAFEEALCAYTGAKYAVAVANGTAALHLASLVLLEEGDKVLTTPNTFLATANAILYAGARPVFVDITEEGNIDLDLCEKMLQKDLQIKALYAVAFSGKMFDQTKLASLREKYGVTILEDNAHAIGAESEGIRAGSCAHSDISIFSFHPVKNMTTGEGGAITTNESALHERLLQLRNHGMVRKPEIAPWYYEMTQLGFNYRLTDIQAALGLGQLQKLDGFLVRRREIAKRYHEAFVNSQVEPLYPFDEGSAYHLFVVRVQTDDKRALFEKMIERGVGVQLHYIPVNKQPYYRKLGYGNEATPQMDRYYQEAISLPIYPTLGEEEQEYVIQILFEVLNG